MAKTFNIQDMMDLIETLDLGFDEQHIYGARLNDKQDCSIGVYKNKIENNIAFGGRKSTKTKKASFSLLIHWNKNYKETETKAQEIYDALETLCEGCHFGDFDIVWFHLTHSYPIDVERSVDGTWERVIECTMEYYC